MYDPADKRRQTSPMLNGGDSSISLEHASIIQVDLLNTDTVIIEFSNGDTITIEAARLKEFALASGLRYVKGSEAD